MRVYHNTVINTNGNAVSGATVTVREAADPPASGSLAAIYSDDGVTLIGGSAVTTDSAGRFKFWAPDGKYDLTISGSGITTFTLQDEEIADVTERFSTDTVHTANVYNAGTGIRINNAATSGNVLRGNGTNFVDATLAVTDLSTFSSADLRGRLTDETGSGTAVFGTSPTIATPTLTQPTIADFTNAAHDHTDADDGGQLTDAALSAAVGIAKGGTGQTSQTAAFDALAPTTTRGDLVVHDGSDNVRLAVGTSGKFLRTDGTDPSWQNIAASDVASGQLSLSRGGTGADLSATGGANQFVKQASAGGVFTIGTIAAGELPSHNHAASDINSGQISAARGGTGDDTSATTGVPRIAAGNWTYDAGIAHLAASSSADLRGVLSDETGTGAAVFADTPTIVTPTIASFANAAHDHDDAAGGGQLNATNVFSAGTVPTARLGSGVADTTTFLRGDQSWQSITATAPFVTTTANPADAGVLRTSNNENALCARDSTNMSNLCLKFTSANNWELLGTGSIFPDLSIGGGFSGDSVTVNEYHTTAPCVDGTASPADCSNATAGHVIIAAGATSVVVNTTLVGTESQIFVMEDSSLSARLSVTCNTVIGRNLAITARSAGNSFTVTTDVAPVTNPMCLSYFIVN